MNNIKRKVMLGVLLLSVTSFAFGCSTKEANSNKKDDKVVTVKAKEDKSASEDAKEAKSPAEAAMDYKEASRAVKDVLELIDPEIKAPLEMLPPDIDLITRESLNGVREMMAPMLKAQGVEGVKVEKKEIDTKDGKVTVYIYQREDSTSTDRPGVLWTHGGGYILAGAENDYAGMFAKELDGVVVSVDYRLAPEHPFPAGHNDSYNAFLWMVENAKELGVDPNRIAIGGDSAGAGMAAGLAIQNRDENGPEIAFQLLIYPMLDNLHDTPSGSVEYYPVWSRQTSFNAWEMYLDGTPGLDASPYAAPARAKSLKGLPKTYLAVGTVNLFRDEGIDYAQHLMADDVPTELAVFPGVYHGGQIFAPNAPVSQKMSGGYVRAIKDALNVK